MSTMLRSFNEEGVERFRAAIQLVRNGGGIADVRALVTDDNFASKVSPEIIVDDRSFATASEAAEYLTEKLKELPHGTILTDGGMWSWLAAFYFDCLCPLQNGKRNPRADDHYIPSQHAWRYYRHLLLGPVGIYLTHGGHARILLAKEAHKHGDLAEQFTSRQDFAQNRGLVSALDLLYWDKDKNKVKAGSRPNKPKPGTLRRFIAVAQQLDLTYDLQSMTGEQVLDLLPEEFDRFRPSSVSAGPAGQDDAPVGLAAAPEGNFV